MRRDKKDTGKTTEKLVRRREIGLWLILMWSEFPLNTPFVAMLYCFLIELRLAVRDASYDFRKPWWS